MNGDGSVVPSSPAASSRILARSATSSNVRSDSEAADRARQLGDDPAVHHDDLAAADLAEVVRRRRHVLVGHAHHHDVVGVVRMARRQRSRLQPEPLGEPDPDPPGVVVSLDRPRASRGRGPGPRTTCRRAAAVRRRGRGSRSCPRRRRSRGRARWPSTAKSAGSSSRTCMLSRIQSGSADDAIGEGRPPSGDQPFRVSTPARGGTTRGPAPRRCRRGSRAPRRRARGDGGTGPR